MPENVNQRIMKKIDEKVEKEDIKGFLKSALMAELKHSDEQRWKFSTDYESMIKSAMKKRG